MFHVRRQPRRCTAPLISGCFIALLAACAGAARPDADIDLTGDVCTLPHTAVGTIQGSGASSPLTDETVTTRGVVIGDYEGPAPALRGFYIQDPAGDDDPSSSDGIFVFNGDRDAVSLGDIVRVTGTVGERQEQTQIAASAIVGCGTGSVQSAELTLPLADHAYLERFEGMLVRVPQTLHVTEHYQLGRYGEVVVSSGGRLPQPTNVAAPGAAARAVQAANDRNRMILDDASQAQNPGEIVFARGDAPLSGDNTLRGGDRVNGITGVLTQTAAAGTSGIAYRLRPIDALGGGVPAFAASGPRPAMPPAVGGTLRIASLNLLNYFNTFTGCSGGVDGRETDCRGADSPGEFARQWPKTVAAIIGLDADILGVIEVENDGYGPRSAIADLVTKLNAATEPGRYAFIDVDAATGEVNALGTDAIKVGLLYRPSRVHPVGRTGALSSTAFVHGGESSPRNRPSLAQAFAQHDGDTIVVNVNHFKSKGSACDVPDAGDGQGNCNRARTVASRELLAWLAADPTGTAVTDVLIIGDLNAYAREDPIEVLRRGGFTDLLARHEGRDAYSYVFNGQWGHLDYALASPGLAAQVTGAASWHINADEPPVLDYNTNFRSAAQHAALYRPDPFRSSDHDPILVGIDPSRVRPVR